MTKSKVTDGANDRPIDATIAQTGTGLPDDSSKPIDIDDDEAARIEQSIRGTGGEMPTGQDVPYDGDNAEGSDEHTITDQSPEERLKKEVQQEIEGPLKGSA